MKQNQVIKKFETTLYGYQELVTDLLSEHGMKPAQFLGMALNTVKRDKTLTKVLESNPKSVFGSILICAELGLSPTKEMGECWLIPYKGVCQFQLGYKGLVSLIYRHPNVRGVEAECVFENDDFSYSLGLNPVLTHVPTNEERGKLIYAYAIIRFSDREPLFKVMSIKDLKQYQKLSKAGDKGLWFSPKDPQFWLPKKTVIKQLCKLIPKNLLINQALHTDSVIEGGGAVTLSDKNEVVVVDAKDLHSVGGGYTNKAEKLLAERGVEVITKEEAPKDSFLKDTINNNT